MIDPTLQRYRDYLDKIRLVLEKYIKETDDLFEEMDASMYQIKHNGDGEHI